MALRRAITLTVAAALVSWALYAVVSWFTPVGMLRTLLDLPETLWSNLPHVPGLGQATRDVPSAIRRTEEATAALREQAAAANAALSQAAAARTQVKELKRQLADAQAELAPVRRREAELEGDSKAQAARVAELEAALERAGLAPVPKVATRKDAVETLRKLGY